MLPVEITSLNTSMTTTGPGVREPVSGKPIPVDFIDLVIVPGLGFTASGHRIGRGMGFYDRFLAQSEFLGVSCGLAFEEQIVGELPVLDHDIPLGMLATVGAFAVSLRIVLRPNNFVGSKQRAVGRKTRSSFFRRPQFLPTAYCLQPTDLRTRRFS